MPNMTGPKLRGRYVASRRSIAARVRPLGLALSSTDGRWAMVSTGLTLLVAGGIAWLALGTTPLTSPAVGAPFHPRLSYELFLKLVNFAGAPAPGAKPAGSDEDQANGQPNEETRTVTLDRGDTLAGTLEDVGVSPADANAAIAALGKDLDPHSLKAGMSIDLTYSIAPTIDASGAAAPKTTVVTVNGRQVTVPTDSDDDKGATEEGSQAIARLLSLHFSPAVDQDITVTRATDGSFTADVVKKELAVHHHKAGATIDSSLYLAGMQAGIPADIVIELIRMFSYKVDFQRDLHPGDSFEVYYDYYYTPEGQPAKTGAISYAKMQLGGRNIVLYRYQADPGEPADYFDGTGQSAKGLLMKTPVDGARISSGFGSRFHPILGYTRMHKGVDFAVPTGTPVMAAGGGTISFMGWASGYGNFVRIEHGNGFSTAYGHLSRFAPGMRKGARVRQGQVFAYSGMTGMATGPHLHYEIAVNHTQVNPLTVKVASGRLLSGKERRDFMAAKLKTDLQMASLPLETKVADIATDLREAKAR